MKLLIRFAGVSGVWSDNTNDLTMCSVPCLYFWKCSEAICFSYDSQLAYVSRIVTLQGFSFSLTSYIGNTPGSVRRET